MKYIFIHGLGQTLSSWDKTIAMAANVDHAHCPSLIDLLKHKEATYTNLYQAFSEYCNDISGQLNLCGLSLGAILALNYALDYPEKVKSLVLIGAQYKMPKALLKFQNVIFKFMPKKTFATMGFQKKDFISLTNSMADLDFTEKLKNALCDTLVVCGENDNANKNAAIGLLDNMPSAKLHLIENAGHELNKEKPEKLAELLNNYYQKYNN